MYGTWAIPFIPLITGIIFGWKLKQLKSALFWLSIIGFFLLSFGAILGFVAEEKGINQGAIILLAAVGLLSGIPVGLASVILQIIMGISWVIRKIKKANQSIEAIATTPVN